MKLNVNGNFLKGFFKKTGEVITKNSPFIAASLGVIGLGCAVYSAIKATPKAMKAIEKAEIEKNSQEIRKSQEEGREVNLEPLTKKEKAFIYAKCYWKTGLLTLVTAGCVVGGVILANRQTKAMALLYGTAATTLEQYKEAAKDVVGEKKERAIHDKMVRDKTNGDHLDDDGMVISTGNGNTLCVDAISGRAFYSDLETVRRCINDLNNSLMQVGQVSLNDYFYALGIDEIKYEYASQIGWSYEKGVCGRLIEAVYTSSLTPKGKPYMIIDITTAPKNVFQDLDY